MTVLGSAEEVRDAVTVEIHDRRADVVALDVLCHQGTFVLEEPFAIARVHLAEKVRTGGIQENVELAVAVPVHDAEFAAAAFPGCAELNL